MFIIVKPVVIWLKYCRYGVKLSINQSFIIVNPWVYLGGRCRHWWPWLRGQRPHRVFRRPPPPLHRSWCPYVDLYNDTTNTYSKHSRGTVKLLSRGMVIKPGEAVAQGRTSNQMQQISRAFPYRWISNSLFPNCKKQWNSYFY